MNPNEEDLPRLLASDLYRYFPLLDQIYRERLFAYALKVTGNPDDAEDIVQEAFINAFEALAAFSCEEVENTHLQPYLYKIAYHCFIDMRRRRKILTESYDNRKATVSVETLEGSLFEQPEPYWENLEFLQKFYTFLKSIPPKYQKALELKYIMQLSYTEIAKELGISVQKAKGLVAYGLKKLRKAASEHGYNDSTWLR